MYLVAIKQQSVFKMLVKLARIFIGIVQRGETFSPEKATPNFTQAA
jgi:transposase